MIIKGRLYSLCSQDLSGRTVKAGVQIVSPVSNEVKGGKSGLNDDNSTRPLWLINDFLLPKYIAAVCLQELVY